MHKLVLRTDSDIQTVYAAMEPELRFDFSRTKAEMTVEGGEVVITVEGADTSSIRASANSLLQGLAITQRITSVTKES